MCCYLNQILIKQTSENINCNQKTYISEPIHTGATRLPARLWEATWTRLEYESSGNLQGDFKSPPGQEAFQWPIKQQSALWEGGVCLRNVCYLPVKLLQLRQRSDFWGNFHWNQWVQVAYKSDWSSTGTFSEVGATSVVCIKTAPFTSIDFLNHTTWDDLGQLQVGSQVAPVWTGS